MSPVREAAKFRVYGLNAMRAFLDGRGYVALCEGDSARCSFAGPGARCARPPPLARRAHYLSRSNHLFVGMIRGTAETS